MRALRSGRGIWGVLLWCIRSQPKDIVVLRMFEISIAEDGPPATCRIPYGESTGICAFNNWTTCGVDVEILRTAVQDVGATLLAHEPGKNLNRFLALHGVPSSDAPRLLPANPQFLG